MATVTEDVVETSAGDKRGIRPNHIIIGLWTGVAVDHGSVGHRGRGVRVPSRRGRADP